MATWKAVNLLIWVRIPRNRYGMIKMFGCFDNNFEKEGCGKWGVDYRHWGCHWLCCNTLGKCKFRKKIN